MKKLEEVDYRLHLFSSDENIDELNLLYPPEFLHTLNFNSIPPHELNLKIGTPIMLLRNLNQSIGLCNGTRLIITQLTNRVIEGQFINPNNENEKVYSKNRNDHKRT